MISNKKFIYLTFSIIGLVSVLAALYLWSDENQSSTISRSAVDDLTLEEGKTLSRKHCASCHVYPEPGLLGRETWSTQTLPHMGPQLGIFSHDTVTYPVERTPNLPDNYYPSEPTLSNEEWQKILDFYIGTAPEKLPAADKNPPIIVDSLFFRARIPTYREKTPPLVTTIRFDPGNRLIYTSDASRSFFHVFDSNLNLKDRYTLTSPISDIRFMNDPNIAGRKELLTTFIGDVNPSDAPNGFVQMVWYDPEAEQGGAESVLYDRLARPVESQFADLDEDGLDDLLISEFGHRTGGLFWLKNRGDEHPPDTRILIDTPGCIESHVLDYTGNGHPDVVALCTQLVQSIFLFENRGGGNFSTNRLLQLPITAGSSSFKLYDFNGDGHQDILYTSGDNADYSITFKPYHGVYIYLNDGENNFQKRWFYPVNGSYHAVIRDFDKDGNPDIAAISFFADYRNSPEEGFIFFKGNGNLTFTPYHHPAASAGRWITMDVADWNGNGYEDIILGNFSEGPTRVVSEIQDTWTKGPHFLLLENRAGSGN